VTETVSATLQARTIRTLAIAQILSGIGVAGTVAAGSLLVTSITNSETLAGVAQTFSVFGAAVMALALANLTRRGGRRLALSAGYAIGALGAATTVIAGSNALVPLVFLGTFMIGASSAAGYQARYAAIDLADDQNRASSLSFVVWASTIGSVLGPNLLEPLGGVSKSLGLPELTGPFLLAAITLAAGSSLIWLRLRPDPYLTSLSGTEELTARAMTRIPIRETLGHIKSNSRSLIGISAIAIGHVAMVSIMVMTPVHMKHVDVSLRIIGLVISVHIAGMYAFSPLIGKLSDRMGRINVIGLAGLVLLSSALIAGLAPANNSAQLGIGLFLLGLGWSGTLIAGSTLLSETVSDHYRASAQGVSDLVMNLSGAFGGAIAGVIIATLSYGWLCAIAAIPVALLTVKSWLTRHEVELTSNS
jgi:MFS family permease